jgi:2-keto-4-pentenoate hydratase
LSDEAVKAGTALAHARRAGALTAQLTGAVVADDAAAYEVQDAATKALDQPLDGWKIGATATAGQIAMGRKGPFIGPMPKPDTHANGGTLPVRPGTRGVEIEVAFKLKSALPRREAAYGQDEVKAAIESMHAAIEVVAVRQETPPAPTSQHLIADFGGNGGFVAGPAIAGWEKLDLAAVTAICLVDGEEKGKGEGSLALGSPLKALTWLADNGPGLKAGDWISTGTLTGLAPVKAGSVVAGELVGLGKVGCTFG